MTISTYKYKGGNSQSNSILQTAWEHQCKNAGTPLGKYYKTWRKLRDRELQYQIAAKEEVNFNILISKIHVIQ